MYCVGLGGQGEISTNAKDEQNVLFHKPFFTKPEKIGVNQFLSNVSMLKTKSKP